MITVDGPAAAGKGTLTRSLAQHYDFASLNSGYVYRAVAEAVRAHWDAEPATFLQATLEAARSLDSQDLDNPTLAGEAVAQAASRLSAHPEVRAALLAFQRQFILQLPPAVPGVVLDGRDMGTVVWPQADVKLFIEADVAVRARRRHQELLQRTHNASFDSVLQAMKERDSRDQNRSVSPLKPAEDAIIVDTSTLSSAQVLRIAICAIDKIYVMG